jgi:hypothetical protein
MLAKYRLWISRTSSGSRRSESGVNPTRSQKSTLTNRRSRSPRLMSADLEELDGWGTGEVSLKVGAGAERGVGMESALPHWPQKRLPAGFCCPQVEQKSSPGCALPCEAEVSIDLLQLSTWSYECSEERGVKRPYQELRIHNGMLEKGSSAILSESLSLGKPGWKKNCTYSKPILLVEGG